MTEDEVAQFGRGDTGFGALTCERGTLPLVAMQIDARVRGVMSAITMAQTFVNTAPVPIEATYIFPLPDRAAVTRFTMEVNGRVITGVIDERGAAREQYDQAIAEGRRAAITEEERAGVFTLRVGNLMPGETAVVRLTLVGPLPVDDGEVTFRFPLVVAPRYIPGIALGGEQAGLGTAPDTNQVPDASRISPPVRLPGLPNPVRLALRVAIEDQIVDDLISSLHAVTTTNQDARVIDLQPGERLDRDFILRWTISRDELRSQLVCADDDTGGTFMLTLVPPATKAVAQKPRDVVFLLDRSGSMSGWKMVAARRACARMIDTLSGNDRFCAIAFDSTFETVGSKDLTAATDRARFTAVEALAAVDARGGTEMAQPFAHALSLVKSGYDDRERIVILITDGQVGNEDYMVSLIGETKARIFTLGIDQAVNGAFLRRLAMAGGGLCELVESEDRLDAVMAKVHRRIGTPIATELAITPVGIDVDPKSLTPMSSPGRLPDVYAGAPVVIMGRYHGKPAADATITLAGTSFGDDFHTEIKRTGAAANDLAPSWARARIRDLEDRYAAGAHELESEIVRTSKQFSVLSKFTAFLAVDKGEIANPGGHRRQVVQPVEAPAGWDMKAMPAVGSVIALPPRIKITERSAPPAPSGNVRMRFAAPSEKAKRAVSPGPMPKKPAPAPAAAAPVLEKREEAPANPTAYLTSLRAIANELATATAAQLKVLRQRLVQWIEDVKSVGLDPLALAVQSLLNRLATEPAAVSAELLELAAGKTPKRAFWK
ncbi:MAG: VIT domain-containing protein [Kofleriaceae bacterium]